MNWAGYFDAESMPLRHLLVSYDQIDTQMKAVGLIHSQDLERFATPGLRAPGLSPVCLAGDEVEGLTATEPF
jgi:hypothetical protein